MPSHSLSLLPRFLRFWPELEKSQPAQFIVFCQLAHMYHIPMAGDRNMYTVHVTRFNFTSWNISVLCSTFLYQHRYTYRQTCLQLDIYADYYYRYRHLVIESMLSGMYRHLASSENNFKSTLTAIIAVSWFRTLNSPL